MFLWYPPALILLSTEAVGCRYVTQRNLKVLGGWVLYQMEFVKVLW